MALSVVVTAADGRKYRLGPDEPDGGWVPENIAFGTAAPGGDKECSFNLRRRADEDIPLRLLDEVEVLDESGDPVYAGRIQKLPRQTGTDFLLGVECLGWAAHLLDDTTFSVIFSDQTLDRWSDAALGRQIALGAANAPYQAGPSVVPDATTAAPALKLEVQGNWVAPYVPRCEGWYDAGAGNKVAGVYFGWTGPADTAWRLFAQAGDDDDSTLEATADLFTAATGSGSFAPSPPRRYVSFQWGYNATPAGAQGATWPIFLSNLMVVGDHGLQRVSRGFYIDDMLGYALGQACPKIRFTTGPGGSIERPGTIVQQAAYHDPGTVENIVLDLNKYVLWDWGVDSTRTFFFRPPDPDRLTWEARLDDGVRLSFEGDDAEHAYNGCMVRFTTPDGVAKVAGPPGSGFDVEDARLVDSRTDNSVTAHGYPRKWIELDISFPIDGSYAAVIGAAYLAQASIPGRSGSIELNGLVRHPTKGLRPVHEVKGSEWIRVVGQPGLSDVPRRILTTSYDHDSVKNTVTVGNDVDKVSALLEQLGVLTRVRLGG